MNEISPSDLRAGDVFLSLGKSDLSVGIQGLDGGEYSHGALWSGDTVIEATLPLVREIALDALTGRSAHVDVYRARASGLDVGAIVTAGRGYLERPYGAVNLGICTLATALTSWMPGDWTKLNLMLGIGEVGRLIGGVARLTKRVTAGLSVTCVELVGRAYVDSRAPLAVRLDTPGKLDPEAFLRALREVVGRLPDEIAAGSSGQDPDLEWLATLESGRAAGGDAQEWTVARGQWQQFIQAELEAEASRAPCREVAARQTPPVVHPQRLELPSAQIRNMELLVGVDWPASLLTPRLLQTSPSLERVGRIRGA